jgi:hypothetical protein
MKKIAEKIVTGGTNNTNTAIFRFFASACGTDERHSAHWAAASLASTIKKTPTDTANTKARIKFDRIIQPVPLRRL